MRLFVNRFRAMPRREMVRGVVVLAVALVGLAGWLDALEGFGESRWKEGVNGLWALLFWALLARGVMREPRKWGFCVGWFLTGFTLLFGAIAAMLLWSTLTHPEGVTEPFDDIGVERWVWVWSVWAAWAALSAGALSLRWLYRQAPEKA